jgi:hypothetical protein
VNNFVQFVLAVTSAFSIAITLGVIMSIVINFKTKEKTQSETPNEKPAPLALTYATEGNWKKQKDKTKEERAEHNARVLRQYKIKG